MGNGACTSSGCFNIVMGFNGISPPAPTPQSPCSAYIVHGAGAAGVDGTYVLVPELVRENEPVWRLDDAHELYLQRHDGLEWHLAHYEVGLYYTVPALGQ